MKTHQLISLLRGYVLLIGIAINTIVCELLMAAPAESKSGSNTDYKLTDIELLGKYIFYDKISSPPRISCATCHDPDTGGTGSVSGVNLHQVAITGANPHTVGNLKPPTNAYATFIEEFHKGNTGGLGRNNYCGGNFWDGRAEGLEAAEFAGARKHIGNEIFYTTDGVPLGVEVWDNAIYFGPVADQALNPPPNPVEQNIDRKAVCEHVKSSKYAKLYKRVFGVEIDCSDDIMDVHAADVPEEKAFDISYKRLMLAVCAWQASDELNSFSSRRDTTLRAELACACQGEGGAEYPEQKFVAWSLIATILLFASTRTMSIRLGSSRLWD